MAGAGGMLRGGKFIGGIVRSVEIPKVPSPHGFINDEKDGCGYPPQVDR